MNHEKLPKSVLESFPSVDEKKLDELLAEELDQNDTKIVVLDDDPTGVQTVHDISVFTNWDLDSIRDGFNEDNKVFYILTNSRGMTEDETTKVHKDIAKRIAQVAHETGIPYMIMSRSDSTLRGYYPLEPQLLKEGMEEDGFVIDGEILSPFMKEGGRFTIDDVHYVLQGDELVPAAQTEFAQDKTFGYTHSALPDYIEEKTGGKYKAEDVTSIGLDELRSGDFDTIVEKLENVKDFNKVVVNAVDYCDLKSFCIALFRALNEGKSFMFRTAAGLVKVAGGIPDKDLLTRTDMVTEELVGENGGIVVVGSHTQKTTDQLEKLLELENTVAIPFNSDLVLEGDEALEEEIKRCVKEAEDVIREGKTAVLYTNRKLLTQENDTKESALLRSLKIADGVQRLVGDLSIVPAFVVAKGGITSSDIGVKALGVKKANVLGQIQPGIPVWQTGSESKFPKTPYVIFPGNVGDEYTLKKAVEILMD